MLGVHSSSEPDAMPVTARLSKRFYEVLGEDVANELVEWFNMVDATYRGDLRELNELNFARFDAKVEQRFAEAQARTDARFAEAQARTDARFAELEARMDVRFAEVRTEMDRRFAEVRADMDKRFATAKVETREGLASLRVLVEEKHEAMLRWLLLCWLTTGGGLLLVKVL